MKKVLYFRPWISITKWGDSIKKPNLLNNKAFSHYSNKVPSGVDWYLNKNPRPVNYDGFLGWLRKNRDWKLCLTLDPVGGPDTIFIIGYCSTDRQPPIIKVAPIIRRVGDGPFAMRVGPKGCFFFVVGDKEIKLETVGLIYRNTPQAKQGKYKNMKIY